MTKCSNLTQNLTCVLIIKSLFRWCGQIYSTYPAILLHLTMHIKYYYFIPSTVYHLPMTHCRRPHGYLQTSCSCTTWYTPQKYKNLNTAEFLQYRNWYSKNPDTLAVEENSPNYRWFGRSQGHVQKNLQECLCMNHCSISWSLVSYTIYFFSYGYS